ncbi:cation diffusion facilitator family transporter [Paenibacillus sp. FSL K6-3166]|uniref:cation diffusion facilitator family transporter n=1 Tax=unclassified Paenibacillus TaxID=185978 RepID=UPI000BA15865|nr:cation diffusion facilitator family transporter [Paenibacillus sp. VTT E-133291]OZQ85403.1 cation diffusion facilitator family transporter [Paenibacillus sp. VTT E-133291]
MAKENAFLDENHGLSEDITDFFDFDELEEKLQSQLEEELADLEFLADEKEKIGNPDNLGNVIMDVVWKQFMNQIAVTAGEDFIKENNGLKLDLRDEAHIQTTGNFEHGKIATHNTKIDYQERYNETRADFQTDPKMEINMSKNMHFDEKTKTYMRFDKNKKELVGKTRYNEETKVWEDWDTRSGSWKKKLASNARQNFDTRTKDQKGSKTVAKDHTISAAEQIRDMDAAAHMDRKLRQDFAKSDTNLNDLDAAANQSKSDLAMEEWLDNPRDDGQTQSEYFGLDEKALRKKGKEAREEYEERLKKEAEKKSMEAGKQSQKEEAFRIGGKALRAVLMQLLADLVKEIIAKLVKWFKSAKKGLGTLLDSLKEAIHSFISKMKTHLINAGNTVFSTVAAAIMGPVFGTIKKIWMLLKQGWKSLKDAVNYIKSSENKGKPIGRLLLETGKIIIAGLTGAGAVVLGEVVEKGLMAIPIFSIVLPLIGSLANIIGIFLGAVVAGIIGAIAINLIEKRIEKSQKGNVVWAQVKKSNEVLNLQHQVRIVSEAKLEHTKANAVNEIKKRHVAAANLMSESLKNIAANCEDDESIHNTFDDIDNLFDELE